MSQMFYRLALPLVAACLVWMAIGFSSLAQSAPTGNGSDGSSVKGEVRAAGGKLTLRIHGTAASNLFLGTSLWARGVTQTTPLAQGRHQTFEVRRGPIDINVSVPAEFAGGVWEASLWSKKVPKAICTYGATCMYCANNGHHMEGLVKGSYIYGKLQ